MYRSPAMMPMRLFNIKPSVNIRIGISVGLDTFNCCTADGKWAALNASAAIIFPIHNATLVFPNGVKASLK